MGDKNESFLGDLARRIPGYGGYLKQEARRDDDRLTREFLVSRLRDCLATLDRLGARAVSAGDLETPAAIQRVRSRVDLAQSRLSAAVEGYGGWFNRRTVDEPLLKQVADLDANLLALVDQLDAMATSFWKEDKPFDSSEIADALELLHARLNRRDELLRQA